MERIKSRVASTKGKNPVCGTRILPNERCRLSNSTNPANPARTIETASWERFIASERIRESLNCRFLQPSRPPTRSEEHTSELQSRVDISYAVFCLKKKKQ